MSGFIFVAGTFFDDFCAFECALLPGKDSSDGLIFSFETERTVSSFVRSPYHSHIVAKLKHQ